MAVIPLGEGDWQSVSENIPRIKLHNMYITDDPASPDGMTRVSRPTLSAFTTIPETPIVGAFQLDGVLGGLPQIAYIVAGQSLYQLNTIAGTSTRLGVVPGTNYCQFAGTAERLLVVRDGRVWSVGLAAGVVEVNIPDDQFIHSIASIDGYFLLSVTDSNVFYWINPGDVDPDALNFASAERYPDPIESIGISNDEIWFIGTKGPEVWQVTGTADAPFERIPARDYNEGCYSRDTMLAVTLQDNPALIWVTSTGSVALAQGSTHRVSNESVEELLRVELSQPTTTLRAWSFRYNRHDFYVLTCDSFTYVFDLFRREWGRWDTYEQDYWQAALGFQVNGTVYGCDALTDDIWVLEEGATDNGQPVIREISGGIHNTGKPFSCNDITVRVNAGWDPDYEAEPVLEFRFSDDQGATWVSFYQGMGLTGQYMTDVTYRSLGLIVRPGRLIEFRFSDPARIRLDYATLNEAEG